MRIVIDMQGAQSDSRFRGIGRYSLSLAKAIALNSGNHEVWLVLNAQLSDSIEPIRQEFSGIIPIEKIRIFDIPLPRSSESWETLSAEIIREVFLHEIRPDVVLVTSVFEGYGSPAVTSIGAHASGNKTAAILYDLIPLLHKEKYLSDAEMQEHYTRKIGWIKNAGLLLAISESSRQEAIKNLGIDIKNIVNISTAVDDRFCISNATTEFKQKILGDLGIERAMLLYAPGGFDQRKNFHRLIKAYSDLPLSLRTSHQLVIVSKLNTSQREALETMAKNAGLQKHELVLTGYVPDQTLMCLYSLARLFVFPSLHEGFGLPALEAMSCGAPVIGSGVTSLPEVIGLDEAMFDPTSVQEMSRLIELGLTDESFRARLLTHGKKQIQKFSWEKTAQTALLALEDLHQKNVQKTVVNPWMDQLAEIAAKTRPNPGQLREAVRAITFNQGASKRQLLLDVSTIVRTDAKSGIQRVVRSLTSKLLQLMDSNIDVQPIYFQQGVYRYAHRYCEEKFRIKTGEDDSIVDFFQGDIYISLDLNMHISAETRESHQTWRARGLRVIYIVYDILLAQHPQWWPADNAELFKTWLSNIGDIASDLLCISNSVAIDVADWYVNHPPNRIDPGPQISYFHLGADVDNSMPTVGIPETAPAVISAMQKRLSFLMVSTLEPRKGYAQALAAFELLWGKGIDVNLVIVGKQGWLVDNLINKIKNHEELSNRLFWLEGISDEYLGKIYQAAHCLIAASEGEGFGLPLIEAAQHGVPLLARDLPVFREVAADHAHYFQGLAPCDLADSVQCWLSLYADNQHPAVQGMNWLTWQESATELVNALKLNNFLIPPQTS